MLSMVVGLCVIVLFILLMMLVVVFMCSVWFRWVFWNSVLVVVLVWL